jgi:hypothetical protein
MAGFGSVQMAGRNVTTSIVYLQVRSDVIIVRNDVIIVRNDVIVRDDVIINSMCW